MGKMARVVSLFTIYFSYWILVEKIIAHNVNGQQDPPFYHPLDPLSSTEISDTVSIIHDTFPFIRHSGIWAFNWITLKEPAKASLLDYFLNDRQPPFNSKEIPRKSFTILVERRKNIVFEIVVNLRVGKVESWKKLANGTQAPFRKKGKDAEQIAKEDKNVQGRCREMGWTNMSLVTGEPWAVAFGKDTSYLVNATRPMIVYFYGMLSENDNHYAHPFDFTAVVDIAQCKVLAIENLPIHSNYDVNNRFGNTCPKMLANYQPGVDPKRVYRKDVHPIYTVQPKGASYKLKGNEITWQNFKMHLGYNGRESLVINHLSYKDGHKRRPLFYRMAISETFVAYGDPRPPFHQKMPFDMGQFTLGFSAVDHKQHNICQSGSVSYLNVTLNSIKGEPVHHPNVVCIHEEDAGVQWVHVRGHKTGVHSRSQRLVVSCMVNEGNYDYKFSWRFYQDGRIEFNTELHGSLHTQMLAEGVTDTGGFGTVVHPQVNAQFHQHFIALRLDVEIDGSVNTVSTVDLISTQESRRDSYPGGIISAQETLLPTAALARTKISPMTGRTWLIKNPEKINPCTGYPVGWKLIPHNAPPLFIRNDSQLHPKCAWADYNIWVMKYCEDQLYAGGLYLNGDDLPEWLNKNPDEDLTRADTVLYYVFGYTHIPRSEDFPLLSVESTGFVLKPSNFFIKNPALN